MPDPIHEDAFGDAERDPLAVAIYGALTAEVLRLTELLAEIERLAVQIITLPGAVPTERYWWLVCEIRRLAAQARQE